MRVHWQLKLAHLHDPMQGGLSQVEPFARMGSNVDVINAMFDRALLTGVGAGFFLEPLYSIQKVCPLTAVHKFFTRFSQGYKGHYQWYDRCHFTLVLSLW